MAWSMRLRLMPQIGFRPRPDPKWAHLARNLRALRHANRDLAGLPRVNYPTTITDSHTLSPCIAVNDLHLTSSALEEAPKTYPSTRFGSPSSHTRSTSVLLATRCQCAQAWLTTVTYWTGWTDTSLKSGTGTS